MVLNPSFDAGIFFANGQLLLQPSLSIGTIERRGIRQFEPLCRSAGAKKPLLASFLSGCRQGYSYFHQLTL